MYPLNLFTRQTFHTEVVKTSNGRANLRRVFRRTCPAGTRPKTNPAPASAIGADFAKGTERAIAAELVVRIGRPIWVEGCSDQTPAGEAALAAEGHGTLRNQARRGNRGAQSTSIM